MLNQPSIQSAYTASIKCNVTYSTVALEAVAKAVADHYDLGVVKNCCFWYHGLSDIYLIETSLNRYIFRISHHHWRSRSEILFELEFLTFLRYHQLPVASPLHTTTGELCLEIEAPEGRRYGALFEYAEGSVPLGDCNYTQSYTLGETVAKIHQVSQNFVSSSERSPLTPSFILDESIAIIAPFLEKQREHLRTLLTITEEVKAQLDELPKTTPHWTVCWGDPHSGNAHFTSDDQLMLFDFDQCGYGWRAFDIGKFRQVSLQAGCSHKIREAFLDGYESLVSLTPVELDSLQALSLAAYIWGWAIHLNRALYFDYSRLDDYYFNRRLEKLKQLQSGSY